MARIVPPAMVTGG